jgi:aarF domain-containing kinase
MKSKGIGRTFELLKLAARVGIKELQSGDLSSRVEQAVLIAKSLSQLKGGAMKVGQLLSLDLDDYFPPEAVEVLSQLQNAATSQPFEEIERVINSEIKGPNRKLISDISRIPIGVASIGQVHRARMAQRDIVLKVQYPKVAESVDADLNILKILASSFCQLSGRKMNLDGLFKEFKFILEQELDYSLEAGFQREFSEKISHLNQSSVCQFRVPEIFAELSGRKVLAMSYEPGLTFRQWLIQNPTRRDKDQVALAILDLYFHEFFEWGLVQTDPNWGNFLIDKKKSEISLVLLDFGATRRYRAEFVKKYIAILDLASQKNPKAFRELAVDMAFIDARESEAAFLAFEEMLKTAIKPFFVQTSGSTFFDFSDRNHTLESQAAVKALSRELVYSPPPYSLVFLHRKLAGVYSILKSLEVKLDISPYWQMMKDLSKRDV